MESTTNRRSNKNSPGMAPRSRAPRTDAVVGADKVVARKDSIIAVGQALD